MTVSEVEPLFAPLAEAILDKGLTLPQVRKALYAVTIHARAEASRIQTGHRRAISGRGSVRGVGDGDGRPQAQTPRQSQHH